MHSNIYFIRNGGTVLLSGDKFRWDASCHISSELGNWKSALPGSQAH